MKYILIIFISVASLVLAELLLRLAGLQPHHYRDYHLRSVPFNAYVPDSIFGTALGQGHFKIEINDSCYYNTTHIVSNNNVIRKIYDKNTEIGHPLVDFHGCSFTYGMGVNDTEPYPYLWAQSHPDYIVRNFGCPGYSTLDALLILQRQKIQNDLPSAAVINYLDFHDERNWGSASWREGLQEGIMSSSSRLLSEKTGRTVSQCRFPFAKVSNGGLMIEWFNVNQLYHRFCGRDYSALIYAIEKVFNRCVYNKSDPGLTTRAIFEKIKSICKKNNVKLVVTIMSQNSKSKSMQNFLKRNNFNCQDISIDFSNPLYTNQPPDTHPSPLAHRIFAAKLDSLFL
jgi:hypothetical protein